MDNLSRFVGLNNIILVKEQPKERTTKGGIIMIDNGAGRKARPIAGLVVKACDDSKVKEGYIVYYSAGLGTEVMLDDVPYVLLREVDLKCGFKPE